MLRKENIIFHFRQELETDSTAFWWLKLCKRSNRTKNRPTRARSTKHHQSLRDRNVSIEVVHTVKPQRSIKQQPRVRGQSKLFQNKITQNFRYLFWIFLMEFLGIIVF